MDWKKLSLTVAMGLSLALMASAGPAPGVVIYSTAAGDLRIDVRGKLFTIYHFTHVPKPNYYPVIGPDQLPMTRKWPMEETTDEQHDHPHHRGMWYGLSRVNGFDFWTEGKGSCRIVHDGFVEIKSGEEFGVVRSKDKWLAPDGSVVCNDSRTLRVFNRPDNERLFDFEITLHAPPDKTVVIGDDKDAAFAIRVAESMRLTHQKSPGEGHILLSTGVRDGQAWGKRADWCDYYGPVNGRTVGIAIFDNPANLRHPTWWHVRDYGLFAANPFGIHDFEKKPRGTGDYTLSPGQSLTFRYRIYMHEGNPNQARVAEEYDRYRTGTD